MSVTDLNTKHWPYKAPPIEVDYTVVSDERPRFDPVHFFKGLLLAIWLTLPLGFLGGLAHVHLGW